MIPTYYLGKTKKKNTLGNSAVTPWGGIDAVTKVNLVIACLFFFFFSIEFACVSHGYSTG